MNPLIIPPAHHDMITRLFKGGDQIITGIAAAQARADKEGK